MGILAVCGNIISTLTAHFSGYKYVMILKMDYTDLMEL